MLAIVIADAPEPSGDLDAVGIDARGLFGFALEARWLVLRVEAAPGGVEWCAECDVAPDFVREVFVGLVPAVFVLIEIEDRQGGGFVVVHLFALPFILHEWELFAPFGGYFLDRVDFFISFFMLIP